MSREAHYLEAVRSPQDLKKLNMAQLEALADELREVLVKTVSRTGGHLAANLGVVELTLALHTVFNSPTDKIIWDVGHQCYVHKLVTDRQEQFATLRQFGGMSGFPKQEESPYDAFNTGHSSTSISAALGIALARDYFQEKYEVIAVIGDGALSGGLAYEGLNHAGHLQTHITVVLNDNEMSIAQNVGAMAGYLSRVRSSPRYFQSKQELENWLQKLPNGPHLVKLARRFKDSFKYFLIPGMLFEELGFTYLGPVDGHDIKAIQEVLARSRSIPGPVLVHVLTQKGRGYSLAAQNPDLFHGIGPFEVGTGKVLAAKRAPTYTEIFGRTITRLAEQDDRIVAITAAMADGTGLKEFARQFPDRFFDVGIAEQHAVTLAAGMATQGLKPVVAIYSTFLQRAYDQLIHDVCLQNLPVVFAVDRGGLVGEDGETHHGLFDLSYLRQIPRMAIMVPRDENELAGMLLTALQAGGPVAVRYPRGEGIGVPLAAQPQVLPWGRGEILRHGGPVAVLAAGPLVYAALEAAELLAGEGIGVTVADARFVKPLDEELLLNLTAGARYLITAEENTVVGGLGSAVLEALARHGVTGVRVKCLGIPDTFVGHGRVEVLREQWGLTPDGIAAAVREVVAGDRKLVLAGRRTASH